MHNFRTSDPCWEMLPHEGSLKHCLPLISTVQGGEQERWQNNDTDGFHWLVVKTQRTIHVVSVSDSGHGLVVKNRNTWMTWTPTTNSSYRKYSLAALHHNIRLLSAAHSTQNECKAST